MGMCLVYLGANGGRGSPLGRASLHPREPGFPERLRHAVEDNDPRTDDSWLLSVWGYFTKLAESQGNLGGGFP